MSIMSAELSALLFVLHQRSKYSCTIFTDSLSSLQALNAPTYNIHNPVVFDVLSTDLLNNRHIINLVWIPSHVNITGNELADVSAKKGLTHPNVDVNTPLIKSEVNSSKDTVS